MQHPFLPAYQMLQHAQPAITGLWLLHGDEPLMQNWLIDAMRPVFKRDNQTIKRHSIASTKDWQEALVQLNALSLFGDSSALLVDGKTTVDKKILNALAHFTQSSPSHCLIYSLPRQDKKAQNSKLFKLFNTHGKVIDCHIYSEKDRLALLKQKAQEFAIALTPESWQLLLMHTENHLLAAYQMLWQLSDLCPNQTTDADTLLGLISTSSRYSVFHWCDALLAGDAQKSLHILNTLQQMDTPASLVLWGISKEIRTVLQLKAQPSANLQALGIWQNKIPLYQTAARRSSIDSDLLPLLFRADCIIKGLEQGNIWRILQTLCLRFCGTALPY